jgi:hypothetical protein
VDWQAWLARKYPGLGNLAARDKAVRLPGSIQI